MGYIQLIMTKSLTFSTENRVHCFELQKFKINLYKSTIYIHTKNKIIKEN